MSFATQIDLVILVFGGAIGFMIGGIVGRLIWQYTRTVVYVDGDRIMILCAVIGAIIGCVVAFTVWV